MFSSFRNRFGIPGVISVIALVFAMFGGAYAASNDGGSGKASASAAKGPRGPRGKPGKPGPAGPQGPAGPAGAKGDTGAAGSNGSNGSNGATGATGKTGPTGATGEAGACSNANPVCVLPEGATETGTWAVGSSPGAGAEVTSVSYNLALSEPATMVYDQPESANCPGTTEEPEAEPGFLCLYVSFTANAEPMEVPGLVPKSFNTGAIFGFTTELGAVVYGTWAVTAPEAP